MIAEFGADALRLYVMFVAPPEKEVEWSDSGLEGSFRFLARVWRLVDHLAPAVTRGARMEAGSLDPATFDKDERAMRRHTHVTIKRVTLDIDPRMHLNTAISALMELVNALYAFCEVRGIRPTGREDEAAPSIDRSETAAVLGEAIETLVLLLSPFTPHMCEELWERLGHADGVVAAGWPAADEGVARADEIEVPVQVNGKVRDRITVAAEATDPEIEAAALAAPGVQPYLAGKQVVKVIVAKGRLVSVVVK
jgi:leucyl-tRNA synthetase